MAGFQFRLAAVQRYREHQRALVRQQLAALQQQDQQLVSRIERLQLERETVLGEVAQLQAESRVPIDRVMARRYHAGQLEAAVRLTELERKQLADEIELVRQALVLADQNVKALEKLAEHQQAEFTADAARREQREIEEQWRAGQLSRP